MVLGEALDYLMVLGVSLGLPHGVGGRPWTKAITPHSAD